MNAATTAPRPAARGLELHDTMLVIFGSPETVTPVIETAPPGALDLPLKA